MAKDTSSLTFHDKKPGGLFTRGKEKYFRSILGRVHRGKWIPYLYKQDKKGLSSTPMTPEETIKVLPQYGSLKRT